MTLIVQKFGGTSVADSEKILAAARKAIRAANDGHQVLMVVSAMGKQTDMLLELAQEINDRPPAREMDMLLSTGEQVSVALMAMAIESLGHKAISLTGGQIGIRTDSTHTKARIKSIATDRIRDLLTAGYIVIAAGFQGIDEDLDITTLGRGGSDTTAVALAAVMGAEACEIFTDVDGVYTTDPRVLPQARRVRQISYDEMLEMASMGAGVMHSRSLEFAKKFNVPIHVRSSFTDAPGSIIADEPENGDRPICGAAVTRNEARVSIKGVPDVPGTSLELFSRIAERNVSIDMIVQNVGDQGKADISFTVPSNELATTMEAVRDAADSLAAADVTSDANVAKVSVVGLGMATQTGVAQQTFRAFADADVNLQMITTSEIKISVLVKADEAFKALKAAHDQFELDHEPPVRIEAVPAGSAFKARHPSDAVDVVARLAGVDMEELFIDDVSLDAGQARVTIRGLSDTPGIAARLFEEIAAAGVFVDMIVQGFGTDGEANLSFSVPQSDLTKAVSVCQGLTDELKFAAVTSSPLVAKLSVTGIGLRSHTDVAIRMFRALTAADINVEMINTSEVRMNVVVDGAKGETGLAALKDAFADVMR
jgi:aspartate kinase